MSERATSGNNRIVVHFSCGAASAVAAKLAIATYGHDRVVLLNAFIKEEHPDNRRFLADCERWLEHPVTVVKNGNFGASTHEVWRRKRFMMGHYYAKCSEQLKQKVMDAFTQAGDVDVMGYTVEEEDRLHNLRRRLPLRVFESPLIEKGLTKTDCLAMISRAGIELPMMYRLGFHNANCIGCPKGGEGYWNKIRDVFPEQFIQISVIQEEIGPGAYFFRDRKTGIRYGLRDLPVGKGDYPQEQPISCSFFCDLAEQDIAAAC